MIEQVLLGLGAGVVFGFIITRVGATDPDRMLRGHLMIDPAIPSFMLTAVMMAIIGLIGLRAAGVATTTILPFSVLATSLAAILFGLGWGIAGYCPGTTWAAAGEGRMDAVVALLGGLCGSAAFAHVHEYVVPVVYQPTNVGQVTLGEAFGGEEQIAGVLLVVVLAGVVWVIRRLWSDPRGRGNG